jgi:deoxyadenosine/deoxycytidine kinase
MGETASACPRIVVVGPCAAGKSTLVANLRPKGYDIRSCVQEHSYMPDLWRRFSRADVLIFLDAQLPTIARRQQRSDWTQERLDVQQQRLAHAREHCDLYLETDSLTREEVADCVVGFLRGRQIAPCAGE